MALTWRCTCGAVVLGPACGCGVTFDPPEPVAQRPIYRTHRRPELIHPPTRPWECRRTTPILGEPTDAREEYEQPWPQEAA